jgi:hypothetical protein
MKNLAGDPAFSTVRTQMAEQLMSRLIAAKDPRVTGDGKTFERSPFTDAGDAAGGEGGAPKKGGRKKAL